MPRSGCDCTNYVPLWLCDGINLKNILELIWAFETNMLWMVIPERYNSFTISIFHFLSFSDNFLLATHFCSSCIFVPISYATGYPMFTSVPSCPHDSLPFSVISGFSIHRHVCNTSSIASLKPAVEVTHNEVITVSFKFMTSFVLPQI